MDRLVPLPPGYKSKKPSKIISDIVEKVGERPNEPGGHFYLGCAIYHIQRDIKKAMSEFEKSIKCDENFLEGYKALASCFLEIRNYQTAESTLKSALKISPQDTDILIAYADLLKRTNRCEQGRKLLRKALKFATDQKTMKIIQNKLESLPKPPEFIEGWTMARKDCHRSSFTPMGKSQEKISIVHQDSLSFNSLINPSFLPDIPSPIVAREMIILPDESLRSFRGIKLSNLNEIVWKTSVLTDRLTYSSTPVYASSYLFFSVGNSIMRVDPSKINSPVEPLEADDKIQMSPYCAPITYENIVIFVFRDCVYCYDLGEEKGNFISLNITDTQDIVRSPVICNGELIILSRNGRIFTIDILTESVIKENTISIKGVYSAPCVIESNVYFEIFDEGQNIRRITAYCPKDESIVMKELILKDELCSPADMHLNFPPLVFDDFILLASDVSATFYKVKRIGSSLVIIPLELDIQVGHQKVVNVSHVFSTVLGSLLISKSKQGFFYVNLNNLCLNGLENLISDLITQPIVDKDMVYFFCKGNIECFCFQQESSQEEIK